MWIFDWVGCRYPNRHLVQASAVFGIYKVELVRCGDSGRGSQGWHIGVGMQVKQIRDNRIISYVLSLVWFRLHRVGSSVFATLAIYSSILKICCGHLRTVSPVFGLCAYNSRVNTHSLVPFHLLPALHGFWSILCSCSPRNKGISVTLILYFCKSNSALSSNKMNNYWCGDFQFMYHSKQLQRSQRIREWRSSSLEICWCWTLLSISLNPVCSQVGVQPLTT